MDIQPESQMWLEEAETLITHWEQETEAIKEQNLNPDQCCNITDSFHHDSDCLFLRKPVNFVDVDILARLDRLANNLNSTLTMVCNCITTSTMRP